MTTPGAADARATRSREGADDKASAPALHLIFAAADLRQAAHALEKVATWTDLWDGIVPTTTTINYAVIWMARVYEIVMKSRFGWHMPHVSTSPDGEIVLEWHAGARKATVYLKDEHALFIKVWGPNIDREMEDGDADDPHALSVLWEWLHS